jgi:hypothetical protein
MTWPFPTQLPAAAANAPANALLPKFNPNNYEDAPL